GESRRASLARSRRASQELARAWKALLRCLNCGVRVDAPAWRVAEASKELARAWKALLLW
ncbi:MAG: hypothetical protein PHC51_14135, partial [bacterium]|nr:hypothetical protein [bacterium]